MAQARGMMRPAMEALKLSQMVIQGTWNDMPLLQLPHFGPAEVEACKKKYLGGVDKPQDLIRMQPTSLLRVFDELEFSSEQIADVAEVEKRVFSVRPSIEYTLIPNNIDPADRNIYCNSAVTLEVRIHASYDPSFAESAQQIENPSPELLAALKTNPKKATIKYRGHRNAAPSPAEEAAKEEEKKEDKEGSSSSSSTSSAEEKAAECSGGKELVQYAHAPYLCENRLERWWLLFGESSRGILVGVERTDLPDVIENGRGCVVVKRIQFPTPPEPKTWYFALNLVCESYFGRDVFVKVPINVKKMDESVLQNMRVPGDDDDDDDSDNDIDYSSDESDSEEEEEEEEVVEEEVEEEDAEPERMENDEEEAKRKRIRRRK